MRRFRGLKALIHDAVDATVELVREGHESTSRGVLRVTDELEPLREPARAADAIRRFATDGVLSTIQFVNRSVETVTDLGLDVALGPAAVDELGVPAVPLVSNAMSTSSAAWVGDAALGVVNAVVGDHLHDRASGLDLSMVLRAGDRYVPVQTDALREALPDATAKVALFVHGMATTEWSWCLQAEAYHGDPGTHFGTLLARDLGFTPLFLRYNTGRHISECGRRLADLLEELTDAYPVQPFELTLIGHSMGGLVLRSACHYGEEGGMRWPARVRRAFYLGSPHQGAPLASFGHALTGALNRVDLPATQIMARILERRSAAVHDMRHAPIVDEDWLAPDPRAHDALPLAHATHHFISATLTRDPEHPLGVLMGDLLVRVPSASGPMMSGAFPIDTSHYGGVMHHELQNHPAVYEQIRRLCAAPGEGEAERLA
ncbi:MAG: alpha/beta hydrolase [Myxococcales bacterium]|nr:alpha/beta hydrolase [Myxococcales bacterium]